MDSGLGHAGFRIGIFVALTSGLLLFVLDRASAEFFLMVATFGCSILFLLGITLFVRFFFRR
jgi:hypothetical protein